MEQKTKVILKCDGDVTDMVLLSDEQIKLLKYLSIEDYLGYKVDYEILGKEDQFHEI